MKKIYFIEAFKNIRKNLFTSILLVICFVVLFIIFHKVTIQALWAEETKKQAGIMSVFEYSEVRYGSEMSPRICMAALSELSNEEQFAAGRVMDRIMNGLREDYDALGLWKYRKMGYIPNTNKEAFCCSPEMYKINGSMMIIKEGSWFDDSDFIREHQVRKGYIAPVIIGSSFAEDYGLSIGDIFVPDMFWDEEKLRFNDEIGYQRGITNQWKVIGILEPESSYYYNGMITPLDSKVLLPHYVVPTIDEYIEENGDELTDEMMSLVGEIYDRFRTTDFFVKKEVVEEAVDFISEQIATNDFLSEYYSARAGKSRSMTMIAENQEKASNFYNVIAVITYILTLLGIIMSVNNKIQNNKRNYAIHSLNGATVFDLVLCSVSEIMTLMLFADIIYFLFPFGKLIQSESIGTELLLAIPLFILAANILTFIITAIVSVSALHNFDTVENLKRKE